MKYTPQVSQSHYDTAGYDTLERFLSYFLQKEFIWKTLATLENKQVLEVGKGNGFLGLYLSQHGINVTTFDVAADLEPDIVGDVLELSSLIPHQYPIVCAFEILEHLHYSDVPEALTQLSQASSQYVIVSVPQSGFRISAWFQLSHYRTWQWFFQLPALRKTEFTGEHFWELSRRGYSIDAFRKIVTKQFEIITEYTHPLNSYHRFYVLEKKRKL